MATVAAKLGGVALQNKTVRKDTALALALNPLSPLNIVVFMIGFLTLFLTGWIPEWYIAIIVALVVGFLIDFVLWTIFLRVFSKATKYIP